MLEQLHFRLFAPFASWGDIAVGENRPTSDRPTRSAILGLLAAALGIERGEEDQLRALGNLGVAMRVDQAGHPLRDYHTTQVPRTQRNVLHRTRRDEITWHHRTELETILSSRAYRQEVLVHVAIIRARDAQALCPDLLKIKGALEKPRFFLSLGRRCCPPALPLVPRVVVAADFVTALREHPPESNAEAERFSLPKPNAGHQWFWDSIWQEASGAPTTALRKHQRHDLKKDHSAWSFANRDEYAALLTVPTTSEGHSS